MSQQDWALPPTDEHGTALPELLTQVPGPGSEGWVDVLARHECPAITARRARRAEASGAAQDPIVWDRARGSNVWDVDGNRYVDLIASFGVASSGHAHPRVAAAVAEQAGRLPHAMGDAYPSRPRIELARRLAKLLPGGLEQVIFGSSGSEAVEAAMKTAVMATGRSHFLALEGAYHGLSMGALGLTHYRPSFREPFADLHPSGVTHLPFPGRGCTVEESLAAIDVLLGVSGPGVAAVVVEPIQGRGGLHVLPPRWVRGLRERTREAGVLIIADEIFTGMGRTGHWLASSDTELEPDLVTIGKGLASGFPISACVGRTEVMKHWGASSGEAIHTSTFLGNPMGCAMALENLQVLEDEGLLARARELGEWLDPRLNSLAKRLPGVVKEARGTGLLWGLELCAPASGAPVVSRSLEVCRKSLERGLILLPCGEAGEVLPIHPPLVIHRAQLQWSLDLLEDLLSRYSP